MTRFSEISVPVRGAQCFQQIDSAAVASQAAQLLGLSAQLAGDPRFVAEGLVRPVREADLDAEAIDDLRDLDVPRVAPSSQRISTAAVKRAFAAQMKQSLSAFVRAGSGDRLQYLVALSGSMFAQPTPTTVMTLARACLAHPEALVRVAAAVAWFRHGDDPRASLRVLRSELADEDGLVRQLAATALARFSPTDPALRRLLRPRSSPVPGDASHTATIVHGTWAADDTWWQPGGDFHAFLLAQVRNDMYAAADRFGWTGGYTDAARADGWVEMRKWINDRQLQGLYILAHSHGGSVAMEATRHEVRVGDLVLLSCPAHESKYLPDFTMVTKVWHVRVRFDLVVLLDGGGFKFQDPQITDVRLPLWFDHGASHDPGVWPAHRVAQTIGWQ